MENVLEAVDHAALQPRAEFARVDPEFGKLDPEGAKTAYRKLDAILQGLAGQVVHTLDEMIPHLDKMQALLSQRGKARESVQEQAGLPSWSQYAIEFAQKWGCKIRTIQHHITCYRRSGKSGTALPRKVNSQTKPESLDTREQATIFNAPLAANNEIAAYKNGGDLKAAVEEYDRRAVAPAKLDSLVNRLPQERDWRQIVVELIAVLEQFGERLPLPVLHKKRAIETLLNKCD